jgi:DUF1680 family protein
MKIEKIISILLFFYSAFNLSAQPKNTLETGNVKENPAISFPVIQDKFLLNNDGTTRLQGYLGNKIDLCITNRIKAQNEDYLVEPFRHREEIKNWQTEFWGKWICSAAGAYRYTHDPELLKIIKNSALSLMNAQTNDGYIGNYADSSHLEGWDIWGRKYTLLGLLNCYDVCNDKNILHAAVRLADHLLSEVGTGKRNIVKTGSYRGMASCSVLEPVVLLYRQTGEKRFLNFAEYIVSMWESPGGPQLISKALAGIDVAERFPHPPSWNSWENGQKAYEMMSCYDGLLELYRVTGNPSYLEAVEKTVENIIRTEINIAGSGASLECWFHGRQNQIFPSYCMMETCVTMTWMKLCNNLLRLTGKPIYADQIEKSAYNALLASMKPDGSTFAKYTPLEGFKNIDEGQCGMNINCCVANGPRALVMLPGFAVMKNDNGIVVNLYCQSETRIPVDRNNLVTLRQITDYPVSDSITIELSVQKDVVFSLALRIPAWSIVNTLSINGEPLNNIDAGKYKVIRRKWKNGDIINLKLDMHCRIEKLDHHYALVRGPIVFARDSRAGDGYVDETSETQLTDGPIVLVTDDAKPQNVWMSFIAPLTLGSDRENKDKNKLIHFYDFASAGNSWCNSDRYKVWQTETIDVRKEH